MTKKIVVTGIGASSPLGGTAPDSWTALLAGVSGARTLEHDWVEQYDLPVTFAAEAMVRPEEVLERPETKRLDPSAQFALIAAREAWADAGAPEVDPERLGVDYATGIGGLWTLLDAWDTLREKGPRRVLPMTVPMLMPNAAAAATCRCTSTPAPSPAPSCRPAPRAPSRSPTPTSTCSDGLADVVIAGGTESAIHPITLASFASMQALSKRNDDPAHGIPPLRRRPRRLRHGRGRRARSSWRPRSTPRRAAPRSTPRSPAAASRATRTTSPLPTPRAAAPRAPSRRRSSRPVHRSTTSRTSTRTRPPPRSATSPSTRRC